MTERSYLIALGPSVDAEAVKNYLRDDVAFSHWWNHLPSIFLVTSRLTADEITDRLRPLTEDALFLVTRVELDDTEGMLPQRSWQWIKRRETETVATIDAEHRHV